MTNQARSPVQNSSSLPKYLFLRNKNFYFKRRIPADVVGAFAEQKSGQVFKSLDTDNLQTARVYLAVELSEFDLKVTNARHAKALEKAQVTAASQSKPFTLFKGRKSGSIESAERPRVVKTLVPTAKVTAPAVVKRQSPHSSPATPTSLIPPTMAHLFEDWKRNQSVQRSINAVHTAVMEFRTINGHISVETITRAHARAYRDALIERQLSKRTIENRIGFLSTLMRHGMREIIEHLHFNPFENVDVSGASGLRKPKDRRAYSVRELNELFASRLYTAGYRPDGQAVDAAYWLPILGPFVGARIEELCQLRVEDVQRVNGVWCVRICDLEPDQAVKNLNSFRRVPLHDSVIKAGFLAYAAQMAKAGHEMVFPTLTNDNANEIYSNAVGKWYGRYLETIGLTDHRLDYHSFRYTFRQQCSLCGIDNEVRDALTGHWVSKNDAGRTYMKGENRQYPFPKLVTAIAQLRYEELRIAHLFVQDPFEGTEIFIQ